MPLRTRPGSSLLFALLAGCGGGRGETTGPLPGEPVITRSLSTDRARYAPGEAVVLTLAGTPQGGTRVRYEQLDSVLADAPVDGPTWTWVAPARDFTGYMAEVYRVVDGQERIVAAVGIDVSSTWTRFPRYGFLSKFPALGATAIGAVVDDLARYHIDGLQFYDWQYKHHRPLAGTPESPTPVYRDIIGRDIYLATVKGYIDAAHARNVRAMFYNLAYGAWKDAAADGVDDGWYLFTDTAHATKDRHPLSAPFQSDIFLLDPANADWQRYLAAENRKVYAALPFDGYHVDQLGARPTALYTYDGRRADPAAAYRPFLEAMKADRPDRALVMNAVNQYGQAAIAAAPTDFLYTEVWSPNDTYASLADVLAENAALSGGTKSSVLAAYMDYTLADRPGVFNPPGVLLADAVIFAFGGAHLELGEHMLGKEYFPNDNLAMPASLTAALVPYYDFLTAYENLLRDGGSFVAPSLSTSGAVPVSPWPAQLGQVAYVGKQVGSRQVIHLINLVGANTLRWRDESGTQAAPRTIAQLPLRLATSGPVAKVWFASPDLNGGASTALPFTQSAGQIAFTVPSLSYWDMIVVEHP